MMRSAVRIAILAAGIGLIGGDALAQAVSSTSVACSATRRLQTAINAVPSGTIGTITVTGTCNENLVVPHGKTIIILGGNATARLTPANNKLPAVVTNGTLTLQRLTIANATGVAPTLVEARNGRIDIIASDLVAANVDDLLEVWFGATGRVINSRIANANGSAIDVSRNSSLDLWGDPSLPVGPASYGTVVSSSNGYSAIGCNIGGSITSRVFTAGASTGTVSITNSRNGIYAETCTLNLRGLQITNITESAVTGFENDIRLSDAIISNTGTGNAFSKAIVSELSRVRIEGVTFSGNINGDIYSSVGSSVLVKGWYTNGTTKNSSFPDFASGKSFQCETGGTILLNSGEIQQNVGSAYTGIPCVSIQ